MKLSKNEIVAGLVKILGQDKVSTELSLLKEKSQDRYKKYQTVNGVFTSPLPSAIVYANSTEDVSKVLAFLNENHINCIPRNGGTGTEGGLENIVENSVILDGSKINKIIKIDVENLQVTAQCGVILEDVENEVRKLGYTIGHSPQSKPIAQLGGLTSTRSIGQFSTLYGGIEDMLIGLEAVFPNGHISRIKNVPRRAAGPDIRHVVMGNEGSLCYITEVTLKIHKFYPQNHKFFGWLLEDIETGVKCMREVIANGFKPSVVRLYTPQDARQHFAHFYEDKYVLIFMAEGPQGIVNATAEEILRVVNQYKTYKQVDSKLIQDWFNHLNWGPDKIQKEKDDMLRTKNLGYTTEISLCWEQVAPMYHSTINRILKEFPHAKDLTMLGAHSSHSYQNGTNLYFVYDYNINCEPHEEINKYHIPLNAIIVEEALKFGGSMAHHHGIGKYRTPWTKQEHGSAYYILETLKKAFDPNGIMNKGTIFPLGK